MSTRSRGSAPSNPTTSPTNPHNHQPQELNNLYDYLLKIILLGPSGTGKSCLLHRFTHQSFRALSSQTIGVEFASKIIRVGDSGSQGRKRVKLQLWDTAGTERFRSVSRSYYRGAAGAILCYDVGSRDGFEGLGEFLGDARALAGEGLSVVLVGCKSDLLGEGERGLVDSKEGDGAKRGRAVEASTAAAWAQRQGIPTVLEVSALTGEGVDEVFHKLARSVVTKIELGDVDPGDPLSGIQYGDADVFGVDDGSSSIKTAFGSLTSDGYGSTRKRRRKGGLLDLGGGSGGKCC